MNFIQQQSKKIAKSFNTDPVLDELRKMEILEIEKGGRRAQINEKRTFGGREYIKTKDGWKYYGKGTGSKAQEHAKHGQSEKQPMKDDNEYDDAHVEAAGKKEFSKQSIAKLIEGENNWNLHVDSQKESHGKQRIIIRDNNAPVVKTGWDEGNRPVRFVVTQNKDGSYELTTTHATGHTEAFESESLDEIKQTIDKKNRGYNQKRGDSESTGTAERNDFNPDKIGWANEVREGSSWKSRDLVVGDVKYGKIEKKLKNISTGGKAYSNAKQRVYVLSFNSQEIERLSGAKMSSTRNIELDKIPTLKTISTIIKERLVRSKNEQEEDKITKAYDVLGIDSFIKGE